MDTEIRDLKRNMHTITKCPVLVYNEAADGDEVCGAILEIVVITTIRGDDYGEWPEHSVEFMCGHTFEDMANSYRYGEYV